MAKVVYGLFEDRVAAERAIETLHHNVSYRDIGAAVHEGHVRDEDVQLGGTDAMSGMIIGGLVVGVLGAVLAAFVVWPMAGFWFGWPETLIMIGLGSVFGIVAGGVAGASECKASIRQNARAVGRGRVLVTAELDRDEMAGVIDLFTQSGGSGVRAA
jgi:hypothetical protein